MPSKLWKSLAVNLIAILTTSCVASNRLASDSFCSTYQRVIRAKGEGTIQALRSVKVRIAANEKTYLCNCVNPKPKLCS